MSKKKKILICFTGIDGSGKTTIAKKVTKYLKEKGLPAVYVYGRFKPILTKPLMVIGGQMFLRNYNITKNYAEYSERKKCLFSKHKLMLRAYLYVLLLDCLFQLMVKVRIPLALGKAVVCDRYIYDTVITDIAIDMNFSEERAISLLRKCFLLVPNPKIAFLVDVDEIIGYSRKDDIPDVRYLEERRVFYLQIADHYENIAVVNGNKNPDEVFEECRRLLDNELDI